MLVLCNQFFDHLNLNNVRYCHWKSNEHLKEALSGKTDLDILVHPDDKGVFQAALSTYDFKCILSQPDKQFPSLEDYLGFDATSGDFIHLHLHYRLLLGQKYIKNHHIPIESIIFNNLTRKYGVNIPAPELELLLLIIRAHVKTDLLSLLKHAIKNMMGSRYTAFPKDIEDELRQLYKARNQEKFIRFLEETGLPLQERQCHQFLERLSNDKLRFYHILVQHYKILYQLRPYKRHKGIGVYFSFFRHFILNLALIRKFRHPKRKTLASTGKVFSIVGADGSGKSTLIKDLNKWLSWKLTVKNYYYGIPKNSIRGASSLVMRITRKIRLKRLTLILSDIFWLYVARHRKNISENAIQDVKENKIVITDRYPLKDFRSMEEPMDNPRIDVGRILLGCNIREIEERYYEKIHDPDRIFVLQVDIAELRRRKTDIDLEKHQKKAKAVNELTNENPVVLINANRPYKDVLLDLKNLIWQTL